MRVWLPSAATTVVLVAVVWSGAAGGEAHRALAARGLGVPEADLVAEELPVQDGVRVVVFYTPKVAYYDSPRVGVVLVNTTEAAKQVAWQRVAEAHERGSRSGGPGIPQEFALPPKQPVLVAAPGPTELAYAAEPLAYGSTFTLIYEAAKPHGRGLDKRAYWTARLEILLRLELAKAGTPEELRAALAEIGRLLASDGHTPAELYHFQTLVLRAGRALSTEKLYRLAWVPSAKPFGVLVGGPSVPACEVIKRERLGDPVLLDLVTRDLAAGDRTMPVVSALHPSHWLGPLKHERIASLLRDLAQSAKFPAEARVWIAATVYQRGEADATVAEAVRRMWRTKRLGADLLINHQHDAQAAELLLEFLLAPSKTRDDQERRIVVLWQLSDAMGKRPKTAQAWALRLLLRAMGIGEKLLPEPEAPFAFRSYRRVPAEEGLRLCDCAAASAARALGQRLAERTLIGGWGKRGVVRVPAAPEPERDALIHNLRTRIAERLESLEAVRPQSGD